MPLAGIVQGESSGVVHRSPDAELKLDVLQAAMSQLPQVNCPLVHRFTPGMYVREIFMPAGSWIISKIHKTEHPFVISKGVVSVWIEGDGWVTFKAPHTGITKPGTRRVLCVHEDCVWTTFHVTDKKTPEAVEEDIIEKHDIILPEWVREKVAAIAERLKINQGTP